VFFLIDNCMLCSCCQYRITMLSMRIMVNVALGCMVTFLAA